MISLRRINAIIRGVETLVRLALAIPLLKNTANVGSGQDMSVAACPFEAFMAAWDFALAGCFTRLLLSQ